MIWRKEKILMCKAISCVCLLILIVLGCLAHQMVTLTAYNENGGFIWELYDFYAEAYQSNPLILNVSNYCGQFTNQVECVYYSVPYTYHDSPHFFVSPEEHWNVGSVCRDRAVMFRSVFNNLNISCSYIFSPTHVYLVCSENGKTYKLNHFLGIDE